MDKDKQKLIENQENSNEKTSEKTNSKQINVSDLTNGLYIIRLQSGEDTYMKKIVIEK